jgi:hypothetical protein
MSSTGFMTSVTLYALCVVAVVLVLAVTEEDSGGELVHDGGVHGIPTVTASPRAF